MREITDSVWMPFRNGVLSYARCTIVSGAAPKAIDPKVLEQLRTNRVRPEACGNGVPTTSGWVAGRHLFDLDFCYESNAFSGAMLASIRTDRVGVPPAIKRAYRAVAEDELRGGPHREHPLSRADRLEAKERAEQRAMQEVGEGRWRSIAERPVLWDLERNVILSPVDGEVAFNQLKGVVAETFDCHIERQGAGRRAVRIADALGLARDLRDAQLDAFVAPPAAIATDSEGEPRRLGEHPLPSWASGDPADYLGNVFLLWLWWKCDSAEGIVEVGVRTRQPSEVALVAERQVDLECAWGVTGGVNLRGDAPTRSPEAARALQSGKMPRRLGLTIAAEGQVWRCTLQGDRFVVSGLALPKPIEPPASTRELIEERIESTLLFDRTLDALYESFLVERLGSGWAGVRATVSEWIRQRAAGRVTAATTAPRVLPTM